ncbi:MAG: hydantoin racemase [Firmicutes bacterium]|nr:hydantoin racemase [Bacillota bacterium]
MASRPRADRTGSDDGPRVLHVIPVDAPESRTLRVKRRLESIAHPGTRVAVTSLPGGPPDLEYHVADHHALSLMLKRAPHWQEAFDAVVVACFYDPGLRELRETLDMPVVGVGQASLHLASLLGSRFSVIVGRAKWIPRMSDNALVYGFKHRIASWRPAGMGVAELHADPKAAYDAIKGQALKAVENDLAEVIVLGCAAMEDTAPRLARDLGVPVVDPVVAGFKLAEMLADLRCKTGLSISKRYDYEPVPGGHPPVQG